MPTLRTYAGSNGNHNFSTPIGIYFTVNAGYSLSVTSLGCFLPGGFPITADTINVKLALRSASTTILASTVLDETNPGTVDGTNLITTRTITPVTLNPGDYCIWAYGYDASILAYNSSQPSPGTAPSTSTMSGALTIGNDYYESSGTAMPTTNGGAVKFGGPTFIATVGTVGGNASRTLNVSSLSMGF